MASGQVLNQPVLVSACTVVVITRRNSIVVNSGKDLLQRNLKRIKNVSDNYKIQYIFCNPKLSLELLTER